MEFKILSAAAEGEKAKAVYTNTTAKDESFMLIVASYENDALSEVKALRVDAKCGDIEKQVEIALTEGIEGKTVKCFVWDSFLKLSPFTK